MKEREKQVKEEKERIKQKGDTGEMGVDKVRGVEKTQSDSSLVQKKLNFSESSKIMLEAFRKVFPNGTKPAK